MYTKQMVNNWWLQLLRGVLIAVLGLLTLFKPMQVAETLVVIFGAFGVINAVISLISLIAGLQQRYFWWMDLILGVLSLGVGILILRAPQMTLYIIVQLFSIILLISGVYNILTAVQLRKRVENEWMLPLTGVLKILMALALVLIPEAGVAAAMWIIGILVVVIGVSEAVNAFRLRSLKKILDF